MPSTYLILQQLPQQSGATPYSVYAYYADGSLQTSTDARGASATLLYNARGLTTNINYTVPSGVEATSNVSYSYDSMGNRATMTDGVGTATYTYDTLSRLTTESRTFTGLAGSYALNYEYHFNGQLKKITDPFGDNISYAYDLAGRTTNITGSAFGGVTNYATGIAYRAWDGTKALTSGTTTAAMSYDSAMRVNSFQSSGVNATYGFYADSRLYQVVNPNNHLLDRYFDYNDPNGSMTNTTANGDPTASQYAQTMAHDVWGNQTSRSGRYWWMATGTTFSSSTQYRNNKITSGSDSGAVVPSYDAEGNLLSTMQGLTQTMGPEKYDAAGRVTAEINPTQTKFYDGDGNLVKNDNQYYYLYSRVLGGKQLTTLDLTGAKVETSVFAKGQLLARQQKVGSTASVLFIHRDPYNTIDYTTSTVQWVDVTGTTGQGVNATYIAQFQQGMYGHPDPSTFTSSTGQFYPGGGGNQKPGQSTVCYENYVKVSCSSLNNSIRNGGIVWMRVSSQSLTGYDEESSNLLSSANASATLRNGQPTARATRPTRVIPGDNSYSYSYTKFEDTVREDGLIVRGKYDLSSFSGGLTEADVTTYLRTPGPEIPTPVEDKKDFKAAINLTQKALNNREGCRKILTSSARNNYSDPSALLPYMISLNKINTDYSLNGTSIYGNTEGIRGGAEIGLNRNFYSSSIGDFIAHDFLKGTGITLTAEQARALIVLHELGHATGCYAHINDSSAIGRYKARSAGYDGIAPSNNIKEIYDACLKDL